ncbi:phage major tail tube protein [Novosphingopyxis sp. YJ-S2-01]|uniref:phage major tail tube protein n=1 Tax=Novosphingopyxis sp. YJ-S2-01 TaxID=2794021 RepID=UPI0018DCD175|nr:phage major tail tube protein [Novosphingopyxis sp. YJ-S2-01]MBH9536921.1 phage major tail tube protein [Novosphingopyxis sp. YJ-S2-01]
MLPRKLKNFNVFNDGQSYLGQASEIQLPKLAMAAESYRGAGMLAEVDVDMGLEKLEMESTYGGMVVGVLRQFGLNRIDGAMLRFVGAYQADDALAPTAGELVVRGRHMEIDPGSAKAGDDTEWKVKSTLTYLKWTIDGREEVAIDVLNNVYRIGGVDRMASIRAIIGS